ncbi:OmpH family outer membrane protein [Hyphobacterium sp. SN044]|uniref:OmpH family outer membrane protein n=1 Tax=Hyphobacterium sp. SN044 TaxID=2912575 RepID=UPI001F37FBFF|nr:OmpH family outer membrane protein [Hyphobacterium sp. SN044]MCF8879117.1 OmpH family outer membrane protein [Hyphobacterium sp. SN044]
MKVQHLPALIVAFTAAVIAMAAPANAQTNVLIMNEERIVAESQVGQHIATRMQAIRAEMDGELQALLTPIQEESDRLNAETASLTPEAIQARPDLMQRIQALNAQAQQAEALRQRLAQELQATQRQAMRPVLEALQAVLQEVVAERGAQILIDRSAVVYADPAIDVSDSVIERLNQRLPTTAVNRVRLPQGEQQPAE